MVYQWQYLILLLCVCPLLWRNFKIRNHTHNRSMYWFRHWAEIVLVWSDREDQGKNRLFHDVIQIVHESNQQKDNKTERKDTFALDMQRLQLQAVMKKTYFFWWLPHSSQQSWFRDYQRASAAPSGFHTAALFQSPTVWLCLVTT